MKQQLDNLRAMLLGEIPTQPSLVHIREALRPSRLLEFSPATVRDFYSTAVPIEGPLNTPCLFWGGPRDKDGYGIFYANGKRYLAHRLSYELTQGRIPPGLKACHLCDQPSCVRWEHLRVGTHEDNMQEKSERGRAWNQHTPARDKLPILPILEYQEGEIVI